MNGTSTVKFYRSDKQTAIWTDAIDEGQFFDACAQRLPEVVALCEPEDVPLLLSYWLPQIHDIACKLKGYKTESVQEQRVLIAGNWIPTADAEVK